KARALRPDLVVMDLQMPKLDGWAAIRELQSRPETAAIPVIVLTGHDFKAYLKPAALAAGVVSYLMKPCFPEQLAREVGACLTAPRSGGRSLGVAASIKNAATTNGHWPGLGRDEGRHPATSPR